MQERRLRLGEVLDDYCPRERRLTNHVIVALVDNEIRQTRCTTCDTEHPYKQGRVPVRRKKSDASAALYKQVLDNVAGTAADEPAADDVAVPAAQIRVTVPPPVAERAQAPVAVARRSVDADEAALPLAAADDTSDESAARREEPVHRHQLIRATLPRIEGQVPERKPADFTMWNVERNAQARRGRAGRRPPDGAAGYSPFGNGHPNAPLKPAGRPGQGKSSRRNRRGGR